MTGLFDQYCHVVESGEPPSDRVRLQIKDTGKGIRADFLPQIFEQFSQDQRNPYARYKRREDSLRAGFQQHMTKPVEPEELIRVILNVLNGMQWRNA